MSVDFKKVFNKERRETCISLRFKYSWKLILTDYFHCYPILRYTTLPPFNKLSLNLSILRTFYTILNSKLFDDFTWYVLFILQKINCI